MQSDKAEHKAKKSSEESYQKEENEDVKGQVDESGILSFRVFLGEVEHPDPTRQ